MAMSQHERSARYRENHREVLRERCRRWRAEHPDRQAAACARWEAEHVEERKAAHAANGKARAAASRKYVETNRDKCRASVRAYAKRNPHVKAAIGMRRYARKKMACPSWLTGDDHRAMKENLRISGATLTRDWRALPRRSHRAAARSNGLWSARAVEFASASQTRQRAER